MKKITGIFLVICILTSVLVGCGGGSGSSTSTQSASSAVAASSAPAESSPAAEEPKAETVYTMQVGHAQPTTNPRHLSLLTFKEMVEERTNGGVIIEIYPAGQLGNETEMTEAVKLGTLQAIRGGQDDFLPKLECFSLPFLYNSYDEANRVINSEYVQGVLEDAKQHNLLVLGLGDAGGFRQLTNNIRPITSPNDMVGIKMRTSIELIDRSMKAFGANTVSVPYTDLYMALKTGVADGQENPLVNIETMKFYEVQKYCTIIDYMISPEAFYVNLQWYESLPADYQKILKECSNEMMVENSRIISENESKALEVIKQNCEVYELSEEERQLFKDAAIEVWDHYVDSGRMTQEELDMILQLAKG